MFKKLIKKITKSRFVEIIFGNIAFLYLSFVKLTTKWSIYGVNNAYNTLEKSGSIIAVGWHGRILGMPFAWKKGKVLNALVSPHRDGRLVIDLLKKFNIGHINGSSNKNSNEAALQLMRELQQGHSIAIIPDGPRGPRMKMVMSPIFYAQKSGKPIIGITYSVNKSKIFYKSWDNMMLPIPFGKGIYAVTEPLFVPSDTPHEQLESYRLELENRLNELTWKLDKEMGVPFISQGIEAKSKCNRG